MGREIFGAKQPFFLGGRRKEQDVARRARLSREPSGDLDHHRDAARIVDRAVADAMRRALGPAEAEMVPMGEIEKALAIGAGAGAADAPDDIVRGVCVDLRGDVERRAQRQGNGVEGRARLIVEEAIEVSAGLLDQMLGGRERHRADDRRNGLSGELGRRIMIEALNLVPRQVGAAKRDHRRGPGIGHRLHPVAQRWKAGDLRRIEQDDDDRAAHVGAGDLVDPALRHADAVAGEDDRRVGDPFLRLATLERDIGLVEIDRTTVGGEGDLVGLRGPLDEGNRLEPAAIVARRLQPALAELVDDIGGRPGLAGRAWRAAFEGVAGEDLDMAAHVRRRDRRVGLGKGRRGETEDQRQEDAERSRRHGAA